MTSQGSSATRVWIWAGVLAVCCVLTIIAARLMVDRIYAGDLLPGLFTNRDTKPVEHYYSVVTRLVLAAYLGLGLVGALLFVRRYRNGVLTFAVLACGDVLFCVLSEVYGGLLSVRVDGGIPEWFQYFKEVSIAVMLLRLYRSTASNVFLAWAGMFTFLFVDDAFRFHERAGAAISGLPVLGRVATALEVRAIDIGELVSVAPILGAILLTIVVQYWRERAAVRTAVLVLVTLFASLLFFGGVMDIVDRIAVTRNSGLAQPLSLIEDGGEMLVMSAMFAFVSSLLWKPSSHWTAARR